MREQSKDKDRVSASVEKDQTCEGRTMRGLFVHKGKTYSCPIPRPCSDPQHLVEEIPNANANSLADMVRSMAAKPVVEANSAYSKVDNFGVSLSSAGVILWNETHSLEWAATKHLSTKCSALYSEWYVEAPLAIYSKFYSWPIGGDAENL